MGLEPAAQRRQGVRTPDQQRGDGPARAVNVAVKSRAPGRRRSHPVGAVRVAEVLDAHAVLVAPEARNRRAAAGSPSIARAAAAPWRAAASQCSVRTVDAEARVEGPAGVAGGEHAGHGVRPAPSTSTPRPSRPLPRSQRVAGCVPMPTTTRVAVDAASVLELDRARPRRRRAGARCAPRAAPRRPPRGAARANHPPSSSPSTAASGAAAASTIVTSAPARVAVAATSWPMNPAPTTTRRRPGRSRRVVARASASVRSSWTLSKRLGAGQAPRLAARGDQQLRVPQRRPADQHRPRAPAASRPAARSPSSRSTSLLGVPVVGPEAQRGVADARRRGTPSTAAAGRRARAARRRRCGSAPS